MRLCYARVTCYMLGLFSYARSLAIFAEYLSDKGEDLSFYPPPCLSGVLRSSLYGAEKVSLKKAWSIVDGFY